MKLSLLWMPLALLVALLSLAATQLGQWDVSQSMLWHTLWSLDDSASIGVVMHLTWWPRLVTALLAGACLGLAGTLMQQVLRNPLASPSTLGVANGDSLALMLATLYAPWLLTWSSAMVAMFGGVLTMLVVFTLAWRRGLSPTVVVIAGLILNLYCGALSTVLLLMNQEALHGMMVWGAGSMVQTDWHSVQALLPRVGVAVLMILALLKPRDCARAVCASDRVGGQFDWGDWLCWPRCASDCALMWGTQVNYPTEPCDDFRCVDAGGNRFGGTAVTGTSSDDGAHGSGHGSVRRAAIIMAVAAGVTG